MRLRSLTKHVKDQNWFAVALDFFIVVFGVFMGFQVQQWNSSRQDLKIAETYTDRLKHDLRTEVENFGHVAEYYSQTRDHAAAALAAYHKPAEDLDINFLIDLYQASQSTSVKNNHGTYDELLATGRIDTIAKPETRAMLNNHYEAASMRDRTFEINQFGTYRKVVRMYMDENVQIAIRGNCDDTYKNSDRNYYYLSLPKECDITVPDDIVKPEIVSLLANEEVRRELRFQLSSNEALLGTLNNAIETTEKTLVRLEELAP